MSECCGDQVEVSPEQGSRPAECSAPHSNKTGGGNSEMDRRGGSEGTDSCACFLHSAGSPVCIHERRATRAEPNTPSRRGGELLEMTVMGERCTVGLEEGVGCFMKAYYRDHSVPLGTGMELLG
ncbi:hypothetical protein CRENBAI_021851 [Crenichthys baileyi]|uniref:Uncharacterized protein n=1 Tax=Crenichthys baileyi TaxID=28760 RepID=A0AAV9RID0_9TELE